MALLSLHADALALLDACEAKGAALAVSEGGRLVVTAEALSETLGARLAAFCGADEDEPGRPALDSYRALRAVVAAPSRAAREVLVLPVAYAIGLPHPFTLLFARRAVVCVCTTSRAAYTLAVGQGRPTFLVRELEAAARAVELGRAGPADLDRWIAAKQRGEWRLTPDLAGALERSTTELSLVCFGALFDALGAAIVDVELVDVEPHRGAA